MLDHLVIQKLNAEGRLEKKEATKGSSFDKVTNFIRSDFFVVLIILSTLNE